MTTNKERIENLETGLGQLQDVVGRMETGVTSKLQHLEDMMTKLSETVLSSREGGSSNFREKSVQQGGNRAESATGGKPMFSSKLAKLEFPRYSGTDPTEWLTKANQFFDFQATPDNEKVSLASYHMQGEANEWWQWLHRTYKVEDNKEVTWEIFVDELWARFGPTDCEDFDESLSKIRQLGSLRDYQKEFERLGNKVKGWTQKALVGTFMGGLKTEIADGIRMFKPKTLKEAISLARMRDEQLSRQRKIHRPNFISPTSSPVKKTETPIRRLTWDEMQKKRAQGLCFNCEEKFTPGHRCKGPQLLLLDGGDEDEATMEEQPEISLHALSGWATHKTMRVAAKIGSYTLIVLIDSGSTHNFINTKVADMLQLPVQPFKPCDVKVANGGLLACQGKFNDVQLHLQGIPFVVTLFALPITGLDVVLGIQWLERLGTVACNWKNLTMEFQWDNNTHKLQGLRTPVIQSTSLQAISKEARHGSSIFAICIDSSKGSEFIHPDLQSILDQYQDLFKEPTQLPPPREIEHHINLKEGTEPVNIRPYRYAYFQKAEIEKQVQDMLNSGLIRSSTSPFSSPVLLVKKKDGSWRFCTDYRALNSVTIKDRFPIPTVDDMLDELHGAKYFTKLDLRAGFHQVRVHSADIPKTAFRTHNGHYEYLVMPFGLCNAPSTFQAIMNSIFRPYLRKFVLVFFDDILIYSPDWTTHLEHVHTVLQTLRQHQFTVKLSKCAFGLQEIEYLGHIVTPQGVKVDQNKISAMVNWPKPTNVSELRGFLGLTGYYRKFVRNYGLIAQPLTNLLKKGQFQWTDAADSAFQQLKSAMTATPILAMPNFDEIFIIESDASGDGIGAVLSQQGRPIAFMSRALGNSKRSWSIYAKEMLAIIHAIQTWRPYLLGRKFIIHTDQRSLKHLLEQRVVTPEQQKWISKLLGYDYEILYKPGKENDAADALSRVSGSPSLDALFVSQSPLWDTIKKEAETHPYMIKIGKEATTTPGNPYRWQNGLVSYKNRIVVPPNSPLIPQLLHEFHDSRLGGHSGVLRTYKRIAQQFYWPSMYTTIKNYVAACEVCQRVKMETLSPAGLLQPLPIPCQIWDDITMDFIDGLPTSNGKNSILVVVDRLSKSAHFIALSHPYSAKVVAEKFVDGIVKLHGMPRTIISDRDPIFVSHFWREFFKMSGTQLKMSSAYHPQTDGQSEVVNRCIEQYLRSFVYQQPRKWFSLLPWAEFWYNTTFHISTGMTPFQALYGRLPPTIPLYHEGSSSVHEVDQNLLSRDALLSQLKSNLAAATNRMKQYADSKRRDVQYEVGDWVFLKLHPYRQHSVSVRTYPKLACKFYGPYQIEEKIGPVAYKLQLPPGSRIHPVFHVSLLKKKIGEAALSSNELPPVTDDGELLLEPESVLDTRWVKKGSKIVEQLLVKWKKLQEEDATWEDSQSFTVRFPNINLEDKVAVRGGGNDRPRRSSRLPKINSKYLD